MSEPALALVTSPAPYGERLAAAIRSEFAGAVVVPAVNHPVLCARSAGACAVAQCPRPGTPNGLCQSHHRQWQRCDLSLEAFIASARPLRPKGSAPASYDFSGLSALLSLELRFAVQVRCDNGAIRLAPATFAGVAAALRDHAGRDQSLLSRPLRHWEDLAALEGYRGERRLRLGFVRFAYTELQRLADQGLDEWDKDVWDLRTLGLHSAATGKVLRFDTFTHPWLRETVKRWCRQRLARFKVSTVSRDVFALRKFGDFLTERHPGIAAAELDRTHILGFAEWVRGLDVVDKTKSRLLSGLHVFIEDARRFGWLDVVAEFAVYSDDLPKLPEAAPRFLDEFVMAQLERPGATDLLPDNGLRGLMVIIMRAGLRSGDACQLRFDCLERDANAAPYLSFFMHKMNKDHRIPIDERVAEIIAQQQDRVRHRYGTSPFLFPQVNNNPNGKFAFSYAYLRTALTRWVRALGVLDASGQPVRITLHQFRHTVGTRMIQEVPQHVVQAIFGHESPQMTAHYARLHDSTLRAAFDRFAATRVDIYGRHVEAPADEEHAAALWTKERLARAKQTLPNGYCGRPIQQECPHPNACLTCADFLTDTSFLDLHRDQRERTRKLIAQADADGRFRLVEMNQRVLGTLDVVIDALESMEVPDAS